jgi:uncharacterized membrane protein YagU involved in acid resistance
MVSTRSSDLVRGAVAGTVATLAHTAVMAVAARRGKLGEPPPKKITRRAMKAVAPELARHEPALNAATVAMHVGFGAAMGALYAGLQPPSHEGSLSRGLAFGTAVWAASYLGWVPALGVMPMPQHDRRGRPTAMVGAHLAFGATLALTLRALRGR